MATSGQISSLHIAIAATGGVLLYAALRGVSPLQALRDVASGAPPSVSTEGKTIEGADTPGGSGSGTWSGKYKLSNKIGVRSPALLIVAANVHASEKYDQGRRWDKGYSDCSSFVGKALLDIGIAPPGGSVTTDYMRSGEWVKVTSPRMGDIAVNGTHMALFTDGANGIGQQNRRRNVQRGPIDDLMANTGSFEIRRWKGWA